MTPRVRLPDFLLLVHRRSPRAQRALAHRAARRAGHGRSRTGRDGDRGGRCLPGDTANMEERMRVEGDCGELMGMD